MALFELLFVIVIIIIILVELSMQRKSHKLFKKQCFFLLLGFCRAPDGRNCLLRLNENSL